MEYPSITGLVASCILQFKISMIFNILPCIPVDTLMHQHKLISLVSNMACNISSTIHMNLSCTQERIFTKQIKAHIIFSSRKGIHKSTKIRNTPTSSIHIVMHIIPGIYLIYAQSHQQFISSIVPSLDSVPRTNLRPLESFPM